MDSMCTKGDKIPCIFDGDIITCRDLLSNKISYYTIDEQEKIPYLDTYKKINLTIIITKVFLIIIILFLLFYFYSFSGI